MRVYFYKGIVILIFVVLFDSLKNPERTHVCVRAGRAARLCFTKKDQYWEERHYMWKTLVTPGQVTHKGGTYPSPCSQIGNPAPQVFVPCLLPEDSFTWNWSHASKAGPVGAQSHGPGESGGGKVCLGVQFSPSTVFWQALASCLNSYFQCPGNMPAHSFLNLQAV